jgi:hypothetical protein
VSAGEDNAVVVWDLASRRPLRRLATGEAGGLLFLSIEADDTIDASALHTVLTWKAAGLPLVGSADSLAFGPDGRRVVVDGSGLLSTWDPGRTAARHGG